MKLLNLSILQAAIFAFATLSAAAIAKDEWQIRRSPADDVSVLSHRSPPLSSFGYLSRRATPSPDESGDDVKDSKSKQKASQDNSGGPDGGKKQKSGKTKGKGKGGKSSGSDNGSGSDDGNSDTQPATIQEFCSMIQQSKQMGLVVYSFYYAPYNAMSNATVGATLSRACFKFLDQAAPQFKSKSADQFFDKEKKLNKVMSFAATMVVPGWPHLYAAVCELAQILDPKYYDLTDPAEMRKLVRYYKGDNVLSKEVS